jgi:hypothetical protein
MDEDKSRFDSLNRRERRCWTEGNEGRKGQEVERVVGLVLDREPGGFGCRSFLLGMNRFHGGTTPNDQPRKQNFQSVFASFAVFCSDFFAFFVYFLRCLLFKKSNSGNGIPATDRTATVAVRQPEVDRSETGIRRKKEGTTGGHFLATLDLTRLR